MFGTHKVEKKIGEKILSIETGKIAKQAHGAVTVHYGDTIVLVTVVEGPEPADEKDFFPLSVEYRERHSAAGKFPGGFIKREGRPSTKEILTARIIDRPIRPLFPDNFRREVQIIVTVLSADEENDPDVLAIIGASAALEISKIPFMGPIGACRIARVNGQYVINPTYKQLEESDLSLLLGGPKNAMNMMEIGAKELPESVIADAIEVAQKTSAEVCELIEQLKEKVGVQKEEPPVDDIKDLYAEVYSKISDKLYQLKLIPQKQQRNDAVGSLLDEVRNEYSPETAAENKPKYTKGQVTRVLQKLEEVVVRKLLLDGKRLDGRGYNDLRQISCEVGLLPRTHGSSLFTRGETQAMVSVTLGTIRDAQIIDGLMDEYAQNFTFHYNFPPFSVGEVRPIRGTSRREIGHGALAERALMQVRPPEDKFAYTVRVVSDITESNGSSSMASVCGGTLALMDAGVPIKSPVAGISIGMVSDDKGRYELLTDIIGDEDHFGDMDFKIAGTKNGITAIQLDIKCKELPHKIMIEALERAKQVRLKILDIMNSAISEPRTQLSVYAPKLITVEIDPEYIGKIIGPGGKMIKSIQEETETTIEIEEDGTVFISCVGGDGHLKAKEIIESMTQPPQVGRLYKQAKVVSVKDFGAFVEFSPGVEGLCHISELSDAYVKNVDDVCKVGDLIPVKLLLIDDQGRFKLSRKAALAELNETDKK